MEFMVEDLLRGRLRELDGDFSKRRQELTAGNGIAPNWIFWCQETTIPAGRKTSLNRLITHQNIQTILSSPCCVSSATQAYQDSLDMQQSTKWFPVSGTAFSLTPD
ncbi:MAG: hypothetical protein IJI38_02810 [Clostridia bacterium]|nr:hypothetical protein [Clostridia bacterium]